MHQMIFVNLPVADPAASRRFFAGLGYGFNEEMCDDERCVAVELGPNIYAMLLRRDFFDSFHDGPSASDTAATRLAPEALLCLSADDRDHVDRLTQAAVAGGGRVVRTQDEGFMYGVSYEDLDGHIWEIMWMDLAGARAAGAFPGEESAMTDAMPS